MLFENPEKQIPIYLLPEGMKFEVITTEKKLTEKQFDEIKKQFEQKYTLGKRKEKYMRKKEIIERLEDLQRNNNLLNNRIFELELNTRKHNIPIIDKDGNPITHTCFPYGCPTEIISYPKTTTLKLMDLVEAILNHLNLEVKKVEEQPTIVLKPRKE